MSRDWRQLSTLCRKPTEAKLPNHVGKSVSRTGATLRSNQRVVKVQAPPCRLVKSTHHSFEMWWAIVIHPMRWGSAECRQGSGIDRSDMPILFKNNAILSSVKSESIEC